MLKYEGLKKSANGIPTWDAFIPVIMTVLVQKDSWKNNDLRQSIIGYINMPVDLQGLVYESSGGNIVANRIDWAISLLKLSGLLDNPQRGIRGATALGRELTAKHGDNLNEAIVKTQQKYIEHQKILEERKQRDGGSEVIAENKEENIEEIISNGAKHYNHEIATQLLEKILNADPIFFENLVVKLLIAMGYKGTHGSSIVTQSSKDGGIDGIINQDPLGTSTVYIQAKRYQTANKIQRQDIDSFYGALKRLHADRGVFITTSGFSKAAEEAAKGFSIVLIDGIMLTDLMLQYNVGVRIKETYRLYDVDEEFFEMD